MTSDLTESIHRERGLMAMGRYIKRSIFLERPTRHTPEREWISIDLRIHVDYNRCV